jgi:uncharacterized protein
MSGVLSDAELVERFEGAPVDHDNKHFYRGLLDRELRLNRCSDCGTWHQPPRAVCPACWSPAVVATAVSGRGVIHMVLFMYQGPPTPGVDYSVPHPVVTVELEEQEGLRSTSTVVDAPNDHIVVGAPVTLDWIERNGTPFPVFRLAED